VDIHTGRHPAVSKRTSGVVICKPGKDDCTNLMLYHFISLLSCMGQVVENVVTEQFSEEAER